MNFEEFLKLHRNKLLGYFLLERLFPEEFSIETPYPPSVLSDEQLKHLMDQLRVCMPNDSRILDLWDWDIHFEESLGNDWLYEAIFGSESSLELCAEQLAQFFLEKVDEYNMDYNQSQSDEDFDFSAMVHEEALAFIKRWRANLLVKYAQTAAPGDVRRPVRP